jgi:hypothetical protein
MTSDKLLTAAGNRAMIAARIKPPLWLRAFAIRMCVVEGTTAYPARQDRIDRALMLLMDKRCELLRRVPIAEVGQRAEERVCLNVAIRPVEK